MSIDLSTFLDVEKLPRETPKRHMGHTKFGTSDMYFHVVDNNGADRSVLNISSALMDDIPIQFGLKVLVSPDRKYGAIVFGPIDQFPRPITRNNQWGKRVRFSAVALIREMWPHGGKPPVGNYKINVLEKRPLAIVFANPFFPSPE